MSETFGRRPTFLSSFTIYTALAFGCALVQSCPVFLFFRFLTGCGATAPQMVTGKTVLESNPSRHLKCDLVLTDQL